MLSQQGFQTYGASNFVHVFLKPKVKFLSSGNVRILIRDPGSCRLPPFTYLFPNVWVQPPTTQEQPCHRLLILLTLSPDQSFVNSFQVT